jgi:predicted nucleotide-binding protein
MSTLEEKLQMQRREQIEGPKRWAVENVELLSLIWSKFDADGDWPNAKLLQRELFAAGQGFDANQFARSIPPSLGRLDTLSGKILLTPRGLSFLHAAGPLLSSLGRLVCVAVERYADPAGDPVISSSEFEGLLDIDGRRARQLAEILQHDGWLFRPAGGGVDEGQRFEVDETAVLHVRNVRSISDYFDAQDRAWYSVPRAHAIPQAIPIGPMPVDEQDGAPTQAQATRASPTVGAGHEATAVDPNSAIFLVHGHSPSRLHEVARFIEKVSPHEVVILHEKPNQGQTLIEKFETNAAQAAHAVILLTADDIGRSAAADGSEARPRGRQNVILELGFFFGKLGRQHVTVLRDPDVEEPSDLRGIVYIPFDQAGTWKANLGRELRTSGVPVDMNKAP